MILRAWENVFSKEAAVNRYTAVDVGGTAIKYALVRGDGKILEKNKMPTEAWLGGRQILGKVEEIAEKYRGKSEGVAISSAGMVDVDSGSIFYAGPTIPDFAGTQFKKAIEEKFHVPCEVENDVNCAGLAEATVGCAKGSGSVLCLTVGTGIGGCFVMNGEVYHGHSNSACEIGYLNLGGPKNFQEMGAASVLSEKVARAKSGPEEVSGEEFRAKEQYWNGYRIFEEAKAGDADCIRAIDDMCDVLGRGTADICYVLNPQTVVFGGGIMAQEEYLYPRLRSSLDKYLLPSIADKTELRMAELQNDAGLIGALIHYHQMQRKRRKYSI